MAEATKLVGKHQDGGIYKHTTNSGECIRNKNVNKNSPIQKGSFATILAHMANISFRTGGDVQYDPAARKFIINPASDAFLMPEYRSPWVYPKV